METRLAPIASAIRGLRLPRNAACRPPYRRLWMRNTGLGPRVGLCADPGRPDGAVLPSDNWPSALEDRLIQEASITPAGPRDADLTDGTLRAWLLAHCGPRRDHSAPIGICRLHFRAVTLAAGAAPRPG